MRAAHLEYDRRVHPPEHDGPADVELVALDAGARRLRVDARRRHAVLRVCVPQRRLVATARLQLLHSRRRGATRSRELQPQSFSRSPLICSLARCAEILLGGGHWEPQQPLHPYGVRRRRARLPAIVPVGQLLLLRHRTLI